MITLLSGMEYVYYIVLPVIGALLLAFIIWIIIRSVRKGSFSKKRKEAHNKIFDALGGKENIISVRATGSRLSVTLSDYSLMKDDELKSLGVSSIIRMSNKVTLVIGQESKEIEELFSK